MKQARESGIKELGSFVAGIERDYDAVRAELTFPWSQEPVEGTVNKIKTSKTLMYGRASFTLRTTEALQVWKEQGMTLGYPKTRGKNKLDKYRQR
jgi:transposase